MTSAARALHRKEICRVLIAKVVGFFPNSVAATFLSGRNVILKSFWYFQNSVLNIIPTIKVGSLGYLVYSE